MSMTEKLATIRQLLHGLAGQLEQIAREIEIEPAESPEDDLIKIGDFLLVQTSIAYPEQYDAYYSDETMPCAYFRLRGNRFTVRVPDASGVLIYEAQTVGEGCFETNDERAAQLRVGVEHVSKYLLRLYRKNLKTLQEIAE